MRGRPAGPPTLAGVNGRGVAEGGTSRRRDVAFAAAFVAAFLLSLLLRIPGISWDPPAGVALAAGMAVSCAAVCAIASLRFRASRDPHAMMVALGFAVLAAQTFAFGVVWAYLRVQTFGWLAGSSGPGGGIARVMRDPWIPVTAWLVGWLFAGTCFAIAPPWRERRGRPPLSPAAVAWPIAGALLVIDVAVVLVGRDDARRVADALPPGTWLWVLSALLVGAGVLASAAVREDTSPGASPMMHAWIAAGFIATVPVFFEAAVDPTPWTGWFQAVELLQLAAPLGAFVGLLGAQRREVSRMRRASDRADRIVEGRSEIASMIAHEVRGPVTTIRGIAATAATHYEGLDDEERREFFELIEQESRRLLTTVDQTSLALKIDARSLTYEMSPIELAPAVRAGVEAAEVDPTQHAIHVLAQEDVILVADRARLRELVRQLVDNAAKFSPAGAPITVRAVAEGKAAVVEVMDEGPGVPAEQREAVFERFGRWRPRGYEEQPGNGLGLFICRGLAAEHQGDISVEDGPGGGTMLRVRLPLGGT